MQIIEWYYTLLPDQQLMSVVWHSLQFLERLADTVLHYYSFIIAFLYTQLHSYVLNFIFRFACSCRVSGAELSRTDDAAGSI